LRPPDLGDLFDVGDRRDGAQVLLAPCGPESGGGGAERHLGKPARRDGLCVVGPGHRLGRVVQQFAGERSPDQVLTTTLLGYHSSAGSLSHSCRTPITELPGPADVGDQDVEVVEVPRARQPLRERGIRFCVIMVA
jgi:hypothetical protein